MPAEQGSPVIEFLPIVGLIVVAGSAGQTGTGGGWMTVFPLQVGLVVAFGALCFGCGCLTAFIVTRNHWRDDQAWPRPLQLAHRQMEMGRAAERTDEVGSARG